MEDATEIMEIRDIVCQWAEELAADIERYDPPMPQKLWNENNESEYYTDKPDWEAYGALVMLMACHLHNCPLRSMSKTVGTLSTIRLSKNVFRRKLIFHCSPM